MSVDIFSFDDSRFEVSVRAAGVWDFLPRLFLV